MEQLHAPQGRRRGGRGQAQGGAGQGSRGPGQRRAGPVADAGQPRRRVRAPDPPAGSGIGAPPLRRRRCIGRSPARRHQDDDHRRRDRDLRSHAVSVNPHILRAESGELSWSQQFFQGSLDSSSTGYFCHFRHQHVGIDRKPGRYGGSCGDGRRCHHHRRGCHESNRIDTLGGGSISDGARILQVMDQVILTLHVNFSPFRSKFHNSSDHLPNGSTQAARSKRQEFVCCSGACESWFLGIPGLFLLLIRAFASVTTPGPAEPVTRPVRPVRAPARMCGVLLPAQAARPGAPW